MHNRPGIAHVSREERTEDDQECPDEGSALLVKAFICLNSTLIPCYITAQFRTPSMHNRPGIAHVSREERTEDEQECPVEGSALLMKAYTCLYSTFSLLFYSSV